MVDSEVGIRVGDVDQAMDTSMPEPNATAVFPGRGQHLLLRQAGLVTTVSI